MDFGFVRDWIPAVEFGEDDLAAAPVPRAAPPPRDLPELPDDVVAARRGVLALRLGQILERDVRELSVGTEAIEAEMEALVSRAASGHAGFLLVEGAWGSGKTHLLTMLNAIAASQGMASCGAILDGAGARLSDPTKLMASLLASLRYPGEPAPRGIRGKLTRFQEARPGSGVPATLVERAMRAVPVAPKSALDDPDALEVLENYFTLALPATAANARLSYLGYSGARLPSMIARSVVERPERFIEHLRGWTAFVANTGAKGLVLTFDELDVEYAGAAGRSAARRRDKERRSALLSALARAGRFAVGAPRLPLVVAFGGAPDGGDGPEEDDPIRDLERRLGPAGLKVIAAPRPDLSRMRGLGQRVLELYARAYPGWRARVERRAVEDRLDALARAHLDGLAPVIRNFVRQTLELLDVAPELCGRQARA